jgi:hypothetical protein
LVLAVMGVVLKGISGAIQLLEDLLFLIRSLLSAAELVDNQTRELVMAVAVVVQDMTVPIQLLVPE